MKIHKTKMNAEKEQNKAKKKEEIHLKAQKMT